ncbi:MAG: L-rhamnose mutarotase [Spirochaetes bacterium]|nr:L-rhamnose mutarotase [Spirochaetota bacterium]
MERVAFRMKLRPGFEAEYRKRHDALWPEMAVLLRQAGISDYSIFLDPESLVLFAVQKRTPGSTADALPDKAVVRRWWDYMKDIMETNPDGSPVSIGLVEVFHLE